MTRSRIVSCLAVGLCALVTGCGGDDGDGGSSEARAITKADFVKQGNAICSKGADKITAAAQELGDSPSKAEIVALGENSIVPAIEEQVEGLRALGFPEGDEDKLSGVLDDAQTELDKLKDDPSGIVSDENPFADVNKALGDYGLTECAG